MQAHKRIRLAFLAAASVALGAAYETASTDKAMVQAASDFIESLSPQQKGVTLAEFDSQDRLNWHYFPDIGYLEVFGYARRGISYSYMDDKQEKLAEALMRSGLSEAGLKKTLTVMKLEEILRVLENDTTGYRDQKKYYLSIFGTPSLSGTWGWRVEGHHLALNFTAKDGKLVSSSPTFFGAKPHIVPEGADKGLRTLRQEEDNARALVRSLDAGQREQAILQDVAYEDVLTFVDLRAKLDGEPSGLVASKLSANQFAMLRALVAVYADTMSSEIAASRMQAFESAPRDELFFAWAGPVEPGKGDYYRVQSPTFLIEYDNTQDQANHSHLVWRDFEGDFGLDVLALHHRSHDHGLGLREAD